MTGSYNRSTSNCPSNHTRVVIEVPTCEAGHCCQGCKVHVGEAEGKDIQGDLWQGTCKMHSCD